MASASCLPFVSSSQIHGYKWSQPSRKQQRAGNQPTKQPDNKQNRKEEQANQQQERSKPAKHPSNSGNGNGARMKESAIKKTTTVG